MTVKFQAIRECNFAQKIYNYLEYHHVLGWPTYESWYIDDGVVLEVWTDEKTDERMAELIWPTQPSYHMDQHKTKIGLDIPKEFPERLFVTEYCVTREYGGPEEGGWWYDSYEIIRTAEAILPEHAEAIKLVVEEEMILPKHDRYSVLGTGDPYVRIEKHMPVPPSRPHYE